jgi:acyl-CoA synthetase (AMP-forming)/AMP-acid ligase II
MPHRHYGEVPCAFVVLKEGASATEETLLAYCRDELARFKVPVAIRFRPKLPKTMIGKVLRKDLRAELTDPSRPGD